MEPDLALSAVEYAIQLAQHVKHIIKAYHDNPSQYENLISRFRTIRKSLTIIKNSNNVDCKSPIWGRAFRRIRDESELASKTLKQIHHALRSSTLKRIVQARETSKKISDLEDRIDSLQKDLDLLGFFTFSNAASAEQSEDILHNVQDVKASLLTLEAQLKAVQQQLQTQSRDRGRGLPSPDSSNNPNSSGELLEVGEIDLDRAIRGSYQGEGENPRERRTIMDNISKLQATIANRAAAVIEKHPSETKSRNLSDTCDKLLHRWNLDYGDVHFIPINEMHRTSRSVVYQGSTTLRGVWRHATREARVAVKVIMNVEENGGLDAVLRRVVAIREIHHPNIVSFYGVCWPSAVHHHQIMDYQRKWLMTYPLLVSELMTHNLADALKLTALTTVESKLNVLNNVASGIEYLHRRGIFGIALTTKHIMLRILYGEVVGEAKLSSLWSSSEDFRADNETLFTSREVFQSRASLFHSDAFNFGILMCFLLSSKVDRCGWDDGLFMNPRSTNIMDSSIAKTWVKGIEPPFLKELAKRCLFNEKESKPSFTFIRRCVESFLKNEPLPDLSTPDCGEEIRRVGKDIFHGNRGKVASPQKSVKYFERSISCGNVAALVNLGTCLLYGLGVPRDHGRAFGFFRAAAFAGNAAGLVKYGMLLQSGVPSTAMTDLLLAVEMYRRAAMQGSSSAQFKLGCYKYNEEVWNPRHLEEAAALWQLAAARGHRIAQFFLGRCYEEGRGLQRDVSAAKIWYGRSAAQGHFGGKWALERLSNESVTSLNSERIPQSRSGLLIKP